MTDATLRVELERLARRLATLGPARLGRSLPDGTATPADAAHRFAQRVGDATAAAEGVPVRPVPRLADRAAADQLTVLVRDLLAVAERVPQPTLAELARSATELRRRL